MTVIINRGPQVSSGLPKGHFEGFNVSQAADRDHDLTFSNGVCRSNDNSFDAVDCFIGSSITKRIDAAFAEGTDQGGLAEGETLNADTIYFCNLIRKDSDPEIFDVCYTTNNQGSEPGWTFVRVLNFEKTDSSSNFYRWNNPAGGPILKKYLETSIEVYDATNPGTSSVNITGLPLAEIGQVTVDASFRVSYNDPEPPSEIYLKAGPGSTTLQAADGNNANVLMTQAQIPTSHAGVQIDGLHCTAGINYRINYSDALTVVSVVLHAYTFNRAAYFDIDA